MKTGENKMSRRRNPIDIARYNSFLEALDRRHRNRKDSQVVKEQKMGGPEFVQALDKAYVQNHSSVSLTGVDVVSVVIEELRQPNDGNDFLDDEHDQVVYEQKKKLLTKSKPEKEKEKEKVEVAETSLKNIGDLLRFIDAHPLDPEKEYSNVDVASLHKIRPQLAELNAMVGMKTLKESVLDQILFYVQHLHDFDHQQDFLHTVIYGPPGTGKTEVAKIVGKLFAQLGVLKKETFKKVTRSDLVAGYLGQTALKTREVLREAMGGVLFIDEAYSLGNGDKQDIYSKECIDTLCESLSDNKDKLMVIVAGYEQELNDCFFACNQGLNSRFPWRFKTDSYSPEELFQIFRQKVDGIGWKMDDAVTVAWFKKHADYFTSFGRDMETLLAKTKIAHGRRIFSRRQSAAKQITSEDLNRGFEMFLQNSEVEKRREKKQLKETMCAMYL